MKRGFKSRAEELAKAVRAKLGLKPYERLPSERLAEDLKVKFIAPADIPGMTPEMVQQLLGPGSSEWSAVALRIDGQCIVIENTNHSVKRRESTRLHELAHLLLEHKMSAFIDVPGLGVLTRGYDREQEEEADWLGRCLHLPKPVLGFCLNRNYSEEQISDTFMASMDLVRYRLNKSGVLLIRRRLAMKGQ